MEENKNKRLTSNDILMEASMPEPKPDVASDETIEFKRDALRTYTTAADADMQNTAQIRGGAVVRPLKQSAPQGGMPQGNMPQGSAPSNSGKRLSPIQAAAERQRQNPPKPAPKPQPQPQAPAQPKPQATAQPKPQVPAQPKPQAPAQPKPQVPRQPQTSAVAHIGANTPIQRVTPDKMRANSGTDVKKTAPQTAVSPKPANIQTKPQTSGVTANRTASVQRQLRGQSAKQAASGILYGDSGRNSASYSGETVKQRALTSQIAPKTRGRTENDDFEIDEAATRGAGRRRKYNSDSGFADSATSAIMSLVKAVVYIVVVIAVSVGISVFVINTANDVFKFVVDDKMVTVNIPEYASIDDVANALYDAGAIKHKWAFKLWSELKDSGAEFVEGTYDISTTLNYDYLRASFKRSTKRVELRVTIPEGYTIDEMIDHLIDSGIGNVGESEKKRQIMKDAFIDVINNYEFNYRFLENLTVTENRIYRLEGYLFPDTYNFYAEYGSAEDSDEVAARKTAVAVLMKMLDNFDSKFVDEYYARCIDLKMTVDQAITLASMVEKETRYADELGYVSSVFHNRLKYSATFPYLNSDATIMYAIAHDTGSRLDSMSSQDTSYETPYNTYTHRGLPPGPIANPGLNAIKYALYPNDTNYFYFVSDSAGRTLFAATEPEHLANINTVRGN